MFKVKTVRLIAGFRIRMDFAQREYIFSLVLPGFYLRGKIGSDLRKKTGFGSDFEKKQDPDQTPEKELDLDLTLEKIRNDIDLLLFPHIKVNINHISTLGLKNTRIRIRPYFEYRIPISV